MDTGYQRNNYLILIFLAEFFLIVVTEQNHFYLNKLFHFHQKIQTANHTKTQNRANKQLVCLFKCYLEISIRPLFCLSH